MKHKKKKDSTRSAKKPSGRSNIPGFHPRNEHQGHYDFDALMEQCPELRPFVILNPHQNLSIDFANPQAVKWLNTALLKQHYGIGYWQIPKGYLCPPIPGRADYIHHIADLLSEGVKEVPRGGHIKCLDTGVGANCIYPIVGNRAYGWRFVGSDIDPIAIDAAQRIINGNDSLTGNIDLRLQPNQQDIFYGIIKRNERFDIALCNPPFHGSLKEALAGSRRKVSNLSGKKTDQPVLNFGGQNRELWHEGGELAFISKMIKESEKFGQSCLWFSSLVSKKEHIKRLSAALRTVGVEQQEVMAMGHGNKVSRILAWTFQPQKEREKWKEAHWQ